VKASDFAQWAEPDGDNDQLEDVRLAVRQLLADHAKAQRIIAAVKSYPYLPQGLAERIERMEKGASEITNGKGGG
jgi:hypothetical protein